MAAWGLRDAHTWGAHHDPLRCCALAQIKVTNLKLFRASPSIGKIDANGTVVVTIWVRRAPLGRARPSAKSHFPAGQTPQIVGEPTREDARKHAFMIQAKAIRPDGAQTCARDALVF